MKKDRRATQSIALDKMTAILKTNTDNATIVSKISSARYIWHEYIDRPRDIEPSAGMKSDLEIVASLANQLKEAILKTRNYVVLDFLLTKNNYDHRDENSSGPFSDSFIDHLDKAAWLAETASKELKFTRGSKGDTPRRAAFAKVAELYEAQTGKTANYSRDSDQNIAGEFVDFLRYFCEYSFPENVHDVGTFESFVDWMKSARRQGRNPFLHVLGLDVSMG